MSQSPEDKTDVQAGGVLRWAESGAVLGKDGSALTHCFHAGLASLCCARLPQRDHAEMVTCT